MTDIRKARAPGWVPDLGSFGARLALVRQAMGWGNVKQAAQLCGIPPETWRTWERDDVIPKSQVSSCMKIAGVTGVDLDWLLRGPAESAMASVRTAVRATDEYAALGERVVAVGMDDRRERLPRNGPQTRTRPISRHRPAILTGRGLS